MHKKILSCIVCILTVGFVFSGCGSKEEMVPKDQYDSVVNEMKQVENRISTIQRTLESKDTQINELQARVTSLEETEISLNAEIDTLSDNLSLYRSDAKSSNTKVVEGALGGREAEYAKLIDISIINCRLLRKHTIHRHPGIQFKLDNRGARSVNKLGVTVYFVGKDKKMIADETFVLVSIKDPEGSGPLKPNYSMRIPSNESLHIEAAKIPTGWDEGKIEVKISELELASR